MSSTNRGYDRHATDYYVTPKQCVRDFFKAWLEDLEKEKVYDNPLAIAPEKISWLDPCAGGDANHDMTYPAVIKEIFSEAKIHTIDIREDSLAEEKGDYLLAEVKEEVEVIITNPPFFLAMEIIKKALEDVGSRNGGYVIMLLRLNFLGSKARKEFFKDNMPEYIYVHNRRMSFTDDGKTDSIEYIHAVWKKGRNQNHSTIKII